MLGNADFEYLSKMLHEKSGLALSADKSYLINTRLRPILDRYQFASVSALVRQLKSGRQSGLQDEVVDAMTTNESLFFRDRKPFDALVKTMLPALCAARPRGRTIKIWCAAASTGQEPYSIAMLLEDHVREFGSHPVQILGTDLSQSALRRARLGEYTSFEVGRGMPPDVLAKHFTQTSRNHYVISQKVRSRVQLRSRNLLESFDGLAPTDIVFCRNVLIYFDRPTKANVLDRIAQILSPDGYLVLGGPETTLGLTDAFDRHPDWRGVYVLKAASNGKKTTPARACA